MGTVLVCGHAPDDAIGARLSRLLRTEAAAEGMGVRDLSPSCWIGLGGPRRASVLGVGVWMLIGEVVDRRTAPVGRTPDNAPDAYERKLLARFWGRFLGVRLAPDGALAAVLRDPSGGIDCATWTIRGLTFVASDIPDWLVRRLRPGWRISFERLATALPAPHRVPGDLFLDGPTAVEPGALQPLPDGEPVPIWRPDWIAADPALHRLTPMAAAARLRHAVEEAVDGLAGLGGPLAAEMSGGLDSAIVSACLAGGHRDAVRLWLNSFGPDPSADERPYVEAIAGRLGVSPTSLRREEASVTAETLAAMPQRLRPAFAALDAAHDAEWARRCLAANVRAILTGKGGDALFIQPAGVAVFADLWRDHGLRALLSPALPALARLNERSVWTLIREAVQPGSSRPTLHPPIPVNPARTAPAVRHPWLQGLEAFGPAKRTQISGLVHSLTFHGPSLQTEVVEVLHPLLAQPVVEVCLQLSTPQLTEGRRDRALARTAFADCLPQAVLERRSKGEMTAFYGRMVARSLGVLRPWLLDGRLAAEGVIDRATVETLLTRESLAWRGGSVEIMTAAAAEGWVRAWEARLSGT